MLPAILTLLIFMKHIAKLIILYIIVKLQTTGACICCHSNHACIILAYTTDLYFIYYYIHITSVIIIYGSI